MTFHFQQALQKYFQDFELCNVDMSKPMFTFHNNRKKKHSVTFTYVCALKIDSLSLAWKEQQHHEGWPILEKTVTVKSSEEKVAEINEHHLFHSESDKVRSELKRKREIHWHFLKASRILLGELMHTHHYSIHTERSRTRQQPLVPII